ncbi:hypothetical protein [Salinibacter grassmerensis]|uniref:hypothetical protein n=1 Tax=Salinibacter grassmerensis TaxID=3040353 RepID=UPI0021E7D6CA|nr:hypothetical protein [Salinibacter grassmerensis]
MQGRRRILVGLLLVAFATGGVVGPTVHLVQHGAAQRSNQAESSCHPADVHAAEGPLWTDTTDGRVVPECDLCATRLLVVTPTPPPSTAPRTVGTLAVEVRSQAAVAPVVADPFIRGPPSLSEARLA